ncbi:glycosyltransferase [Oceanobacillus caeni]|uniref:glycosyltransferase n=1 Tax=Oceanobacillus caeni TaxID=405946 RepID=UPI002E1E4031|nr:glycosyltransferase [Oceanobacillus caeni]
MLTPRNVVHLTTVHHPYDPRIYHKECLSLHRAGFDVTLIAPDTNASSTNKSIKHVSIKKHKSRLVRMFFGTFNAYRKAKKLNADVYHLHDPELIPVGWLLKKKNNIVIYDIHEDYVTSMMQKEYVNKNLRKMFSLMYKIIEKLFIKNFDLCLAEKYYKDLYPKGYCILNYPIINQRLLKINHNKLQSSKKLLYTGNVTIERGALIHAMLPLIDDSISVHFIGKCSKNLAEEMMNTVGEKSDSITIEGINRFVEKDKIDSTYVNEDWLAGLAIFPPTEHYMKKELTKFFEYMNVGLPIICSDFPVWKNFVETYKCGIAVNPHNHDEIGQAIEYLSNHPDEARQMGENGKEAIKKKLNWNEEEKKLINWYNQLLSRV